MTLEDRQRVAAWAVKTLREAFLPPLSPGGYQALLALERLIARTGRARKTGAPPKPARGPRCAPERERSAKSGVASPRRSPTRRRGGSSRPGRPPA